jgi:hypothetical protein
MQDIHQIHVLNKFASTKDLSKIVPYHYISISRSYFEIKIYNNRQILDDIEKLQPRGLPLGIIRSIMVTAINLNLSKNKFRTIFRRFSDQPNYQEL